MEWLEADPIPEECVNCREGDCYNCDTAGKRWSLSEEDTLRISRALKLQAIARLQKQVTEIDRQLRAFPKKETESGKW